MNYSTFNNKTFFIAKNSTLPELKFPLHDRIRDLYDITDDMLDNVAVTFSMIDAETGLYRIANVAAHLVVNNDRPQYSDEIKYTLTYRFNERDTRKPGNYLGEFVIDFIGNEHCGKIKFPLSGFINIHITNSITKTTVVNVHQQGLPIRE